MGANKLCSICCTISWDEDGDLFNRSTFGSTWYWKQASELYHQPDCPLCRLVLFMLESTKPFLSPTIPITLTWDSGQRFLSTNDTRARLYILEGSSSVLSRQSLALPVKGPKIDLQRARGWLNMCLSMHTECGTYLTNSSELTELRLINVVTKSVEDVKMPCRYIALSYVWGGVSSIRLTTNNRANMSESGILSKIWDQIPRTIRDAIDVVQELKEKYLWVDSLCLIQNDSTDIERGITVMDLIYERAIMTIIAASGAYANAGIPGVGSTRRLITQRIEQITPGLRLACHLDGSYLLKHTVYSQRGWTFQEQILPHRSLIFINNEVYFKCRERHLSEDLVDPTGEYNPSHDLDFTGSMLPMEATLDLPFHNYQTLLMYYSERTFSNHSDALQAMAGISRRVSQRMRCNFFQGIPTAAFDAFLIFRKYTSILRRRRQFPSYSWAGWIGHIIYPLDTCKEINNWLRDCTWITWYKRSPNGVINLVWDIAANEDFPVKNDDFVGYRARSGFGGRLNVNSTRTAPTEALNIRGKLPSYPILQFWTLSVHFKIYKFNVFQATAAIVDCNGITCGELDMDGFEDDTFFQPGATYEFILVSEYHKNFRFSFGYGDGHDTSLPPYNVLLLEWKGGIAERRGCGILCRLSLDWAFPPGPCWKEILLK